MAKDLSLTNVIVISVINFYEDSYDRKEQNV